jgi:hypothetical protein
MTQGPDLGGTSFLYYNAAIPDPAKAVAATAKLVSNLSTASVRHVTPLSAPDITAISLKPGEIRRVARSLSIQSDLRKS